jgi:hypothetical protein
VIFHSYVSLPEGKLLKEIYGKQLIPATKTTETYGN